MSDFALPPDRKSALEAGLNKYFTGKPCRNGHSSYRYATSGTCAECLNGARISGAMPARVAKNPQHAEKIAVLSQFTRIRITVAAEDLEAVRAAVGAWAMLRHPAITVDDVWPMSIRPAYGVLYSVAVHPGDAKAINAYASQTFDRHTPQPPNPLQMAERFATVAAVPSWADRP